MWNMAAYAERVICVVCSRISSQSSSVYVSLSLPSRHQLSDWLDIFKTSLRLTEHSAPPLPPPPAPPSSRSSPSLLSSRSSSSLPLCLSLRAPKPKALKRDFKNCRIEEEEPGVILARAVVRSADCATDRDDKLPITGSAPGGGVNYLTLAS